MQASEFVSQLKEQFGHCVREIDVTIDPNTGRKVPRGEHNNWTPARIASNQGSGDTYSLYLKYMPGF
jgi:hypothetical protein